MSRINQYNKMKETRKHKSEDKAIREIRRYQKNRKLLIPKKPFEKLVREIAENLQQRK